jgi:hypothetical protein
MKRNNWAEHAGPRLGLFAIAMFLQVTGAAQESTVARAVKPGRSTDLATEFPANLCRYVAEALGAGAHPVLLTPLTRRQLWPVNCKTTWLPGLQRL